MIRIELDFENNKKLRNNHPIINKDECGIVHVETECINECIRRARHGQPPLYKYMGTRDVYRIEDEKKFLLLLIRTGISYKYVDPNSYYMFDND